MKIENKKEKAASSTVPVPGSVYFSKDVKNYYICARSEGEYRLVNLETGANHSVRFSTLPIDVVRVEAKVVIL